MRASQHEGGKIHLRNVPAPKATKKPPEPGNKVEICSKGLKAPTGSRYNRE